MLRTSQFMQFVRKSLSGKSKVHMDRSGSSSVQVLGAKRVQLLSIVGCLLKGATRHSPETRGARFRRSEPCGRCGTLPLAVKSDVQWSRLRSRSRVTCKSPTKQLARSE